MCVYITLIQYPVALQKYLCSMWGEGSLTWQQPFGIEMLSWNDSGILHLKE